MSGQADAEYRKEMLRLFSLEQKGKEHNEDIVRREEDFNLQLAEMKLNKEKQYDREMVELEKRKQEMQSQFEEEREQLLGEIKATEAEYSEALSDTLNNKRTFFRAEKLLADSVALKATKKEVEAKLNAKIVSQYKTLSQPAKILKAEIDIQCKSKPEWKDQLYELIEQLNVLCFVLTIRKVNAISLIIPIISTFL